MSVNNNNQSLLQEIETAINPIVSVTNQNSDGQSTLALTDKVRQAVLNVLIGFSDDIPHPASGFNEVSDEAKNDEASKSVLNSASKTLLRWQILAYVAGIDLTLAKWFESHLDALSILHEIGYKTPANGLWAIWAAEGSKQPIRYQENETDRRNLVSKNTDATNVSSDNTGMIDGVKTWCSGAHIVDNALMTYRDEQGNSQLVIVDMHQANIEIDNTDWQAVGMAATDTATIEFNQVTARRVGKPNEYLDRVGFWHGAAGVAACWYGATSRIATYLLIANEQKPNHYKSMYLGQAATALAVTRQYFRHASELIDSVPNYDNELTVRALRANIEEVARLVIDVTGQALGATPFCHNAHFARLTADLPVFIRQSHGAFDLQRIGDLASELAGEIGDKQGNIWRL